MRLNSVRAGMATGAAIFAIPVLIAMCSATLEGSDTAPQRVGWSVPGGSVVSPPPIDFEAMANPPRDNSTLGRIQRLLGPYDVPEYDYAGDLVQEHEIEAEQRLARDWCVGTIAKHANITERQAAILFSNAIHYPDTEASGVVLSALESVSENDAEGDLVRRRQCAALLYLGMIGAPPMR